MKLLILTNSTFEEEKALYDEERKQLIAHGDYYHDKIDNLIEGIIMGIEYLGHKPKIEEREISPEDALFKICYFN